MNYPPLYLNPRCNTKKSHVREPFKTIIIIVITHSTKFSKFDVSAYLFHWTNANVLMPVPSKMLRILYASHFLLACFSGFFSIFSLPSCHYGYKTSLSPAINAALRQPAIGKVRNQAIIMFLNSFQSTPVRARNQPTNTILPTLQ